MPGMVLQSATSLPSTCTSRLLPHGSSTNPPPPPPPPLPHMSNPESIVSPGGVGFDINCGVRHEFTTETIPT
jgi:hypothetical protein